MLELVLHGWGHKLKWMKIEGLLERKTRYTLYSVMLGSYLVRVIEKEVIGHAKGFRSLLSYHTMEIGISYPT
jgi:hypothetical protein